MTSLDFIVDLCTEAIKNLSGYSKGGHNGPYHHPETEVRNKGHWLFTLSRVYQWTGDARFKTAAEPLAEYLMSAEARPHAKSFFHRNVKGKDQANGLVGQAWTMEGLVEAATLFNEPAFIDLSKKVFLQHHFLEQYGLWNILEIDGQHKPIDYAFNHQLWFAAAASLLEDEDILHRVNRFLEKLFDNVTVLESGLIYHELENPYKDPYAYKPGIKDRLRKSVLSTMQKSGIRKAPKKQYASLEEKKKVLWGKMKHKSIGYHAFNTYAFAILKNSLPGHPVWKKPEFQNIPAYLLTEEYKTGVEDNIYSFAYNPPGFEVPYSLEKLCNLEEPRLVDISTCWLNHQIEKTYDAQKKMFTRNTEDPITLTARIYELCRLSPELLRKISIKI